MTRPAYDAVIGVWDGHDAGAALLFEGRVQLALNEERLTFRKLEVGFPRLAVEAMRAAAAGRRIAWAVTTSDPAKTLTRLIPSSKERYYRLRRRLDLPGPFDGLTQALKYRLTQWPPNSALGLHTRHWFARQLGVAREDVFLVNHHEAHAASAAYWPAWQGDGAVVTLDGIGDGESGSLWAWENTSASLRKLVSIPGRASLGLFFEHVTQALQMRPLEDEGKVMALATYAVAVPPEKNEFLRWFTLRTDAARLPVLTCSVSPSRMARAVHDVVWRVPREQVCRMAQDTLEALVPALFSALARATGRDEFAYAGGVASNIKVNRLIRQLPEVRRLHVCPAMGDGGLALGAALSIHRSVLGARPAAFSDFRLGRDHGDLGRDAERLAASAGATFTRPPDIAEAVAALLARGEVVMWAQGRMELGARALGARSIVARADSTAARDDLNLRLKRRVWYQPFCPSMLASEAPALLADYRGEDDFNGHMTNGFACSARGLSALAGAVGHDGSCRPQLVRDDADTPWARLLLAMRRHTGTGAVINTSLNLHGKPMPDTAEGVIEAWLDCRVPHLALGSALLSKPSVATPSA